MTMKTKEEILFEQNNNGIKFKWYKDSDIVSVMPIVGTDVALKAMDEYAKAYHDDRMEAIRDKHDQEMIEFGKWCDKHFTEYVSFTDALTKFREPK